MWGATLVPATGKAREDAGVSVPVGQQPRRFFLSWRKRGGRQGELAPPPLQGWAAYGLWR